MRGVLTGIDFIETSDGELKLLEMNTNIGLTKPFDTYFDFDGLMNFCNTNGFNNFNFIYTTGIVGNQFLSTLTDKCTQNNINLTLTPVPFNSVTIPNIADSTDTLILRHAYDVTAIVDDQYCRDNHELINLFNTYGSGSYLPPTYISGGLGSMDTLTNVPNSSIYPDFIVKKRFPDLVKDQFPKFFKTNSESDISDLKTTYTGDYVLQNYIVDTNNITNNGKLTQVRSFTMFYDSDLKQLNLGNYRFSNLAPVSSELTLISGSITLTKDSKMEFTNNAIPNSLQGFPYGTMVQKLNTTTNDYEPVPIQNIEVGDVLKTVFIEGLETQPPYGWAVSGSILPFSTTYSTSSVSQTYASNVEDFLVKIDFENNQSIVGGVNQSLITYSPDINVSQFEFFRSVSLGDSAFTDISGTLETMTDINYVFYSGSVHDVTLQTDHVFLTYTSGSNTPMGYVPLLTHNKPKGPKV